MLVCVLQSTYNTFYSIQNISVKKLVFLKTSKSVSFISRGDVWNLNCHADKQRELVLLLCEPASPRGVWHGPLATCVHLSLVSNLLWLLLLVPDFTRCGDSLEENLWIHRELMLLSFTKKSSWQVQIALPNISYFKKPIFTASMRKIILKEAYVLCHRDLQSLDLMDPCLSPLF